MLLRIYFLSWGDYYASRYILSKIKIILIAPNNINVDNVITIMYDENTQETYSNIITNYKREQIK